MLEDDCTPKQFLEYTDISKGRFDKFITKFVDTLGMYAGFRRYLYAGNVFLFWNIVGATMVAFCFYPMFLTNITFFRYIE